MADIKDRILSLRVEKELTQEKMAKIFNVGLSTVSMWERGERIPRPKILKKKRKRLQRVLKERKLKTMEKINHVRELNFVKKNLMRQVLLNQKELLWRRIILLIMKM